MNRKLEDIKIIKRHDVKTPKADVFVDNHFEEHKKDIEKNTTSNIILSKDLDNHNPTYYPSEFNNEHSNKYDFLNKINNKTSSFSPKMSQSPRMPSREHSFSKILLVLFILSLSFGFLYLFSTKFLTANVTVIAKNKTFELNHMKFTTDKSKSSGIPFELMVVSDSEFKDIYLTTSKEVSEKAKGEITLYNEYSITAQKILAGTFISDENGKSYKIDTAVSIPGYTLDKDKKIIPGKIIAKITSFLPGDAYNGEPKYFSVNLFNKTDKFKKIYGKADSPMTGGMVGSVYYLDDSEKINIPTTNNNLRDRLLRKINAQVPEGYILYPDSINFSYESGENIISKTSNAKLETKGELSAFLIKKSDLSKNILNKLLPDISNKERLEIIEPELSVLTFNFSNANQIVAKDIESFDFELTGNLSVKWNPYVEELKNLLISQDKNNVTPLFKKDPGISSASV
ncbi:MAG: hypothetical protein WC755_07640, partial [Candidatus Woesearchaeota archaeon]